MLKINDLTTIFFNTEENNKRQMETRHYKIGHHIKIKDTDKIGRRRTRKHKTIQQDAKLKTRK